MFFANEVGMGGLGVVVSSRLAGRRMLFEDQIPCGKTVTVAIDFPPGPPFLGQSGGTVDG